MGLSPTIKKRAAILISGRGSNMKALIEAAKAPDFPAEITLVLSNRADAPGLEFAGNAGITTQVVDHTAFKTRAAFDATLDEFLSDQNIDFICLAGFMRIFTPEFVGGWAGKILNIHPSLLPSFKGLHPHAQALEAGVALSGCSVHFVTPELDDGPIIGQAAVPVLAGDTEDALAARILNHELRLYPLCLRMICEGSVKLEGGRAVFKGANPVALI